VERKEEEKSACWCRWSASAFQRPSPGEIPQNWCLDFESDGFRQIDVESRKVQEGRPALLLCNTS